jgi:ATP-dependent Clp protease ATP-binding subunit ClpX
LEAVLTDAMFELPGTETTHLTVDARYVNSKLERVDLEQLKAAS